MNVPPPLPPDPENLSPYAAPSAQVSLQLPPPFSGSIKQPFAKQAARFSGFSLVIAIAFNMLTGGPAKKMGTMGMIFPTVGVTIVLAGIVLGIVALFSIPKYGKKGILIPALFGIILNTVVLFVSIAGVLTVMKKAKQIKDSQELRQYEGR